MYSQLFSLATILAAVSAAPAQGSQTAPMSGLALGMSRHVSDTNQLLGYALTETDSLFAADSNTADESNVTDGPFGNAIYIFQKATDVPTGQGKFFCTVWYDNTEAFMATAKAKATANGDGAFEDQLKAHNLDPAKTLRFGPVDKAALEKHGVQGDAMRDGETLLAVPAEQVPVLDLGVSCVGLEQAGEMDLYPDANYDGWMKVVEL